MALLLMGCGMISKVPVGPHKAVIIESCNTCGNSGEHRYVDVGPQGLEHEYTELCSCAFEAFSVYSWMKRKE